MFYFIDPSEVFKKYMVFLQYYGYVERCLTLIFYKHHFCQIFSLIPHKALNINSFCKKYLYLKMLLLIKK